MRYSLPGASFSEPVDPVGDASQLAHYLDLAAKAAARAARASATAERHEKMIGTEIPALRELHGSQAALQRQVEARHLAIVVLYRQHALAVSERLTKLRENRAVTRPRFIDSLVAVMHSASVCVALQSAVGSDAVVASDRRAFAANELEAVLGEGPVHACRKFGPLLVRERDIRRRWCLYAEAVAPLGVHEVATVPLRASDVELGSMTVFGTSDQPIEPALSDLCTIGDAVVEILLDEIGDASPNGSGLMASVDHRECVHQAAGMVSVHYGCDVADGIALMRAHAFATDSELDSVARAVISGELRLER